MQRLLGQCCRTVEDDHKPLEDLCLLILPSTDVNKAKYTQNWVISEGKLVSSWRNSKSKLIQGAEIFGNVETSRDV